MELSVDLDKYGPWALIAGGSEGVGSAFAELLAAAGINLVLVARRPEPLEETAARCLAHGVEVRTASVDLTAPDAVDLVAAATSELEIGLLVYNAGANTYSSEFLDGELAEFHAVIDLNITTMMALTHRYGRPMRERGRGGILLVGSLVGYLGSARHTTYGGVKAFTRIFAESLWLELRDHGVDVLDLVLGVTRTPAMERFGLNFDAGFKVSDPRDVAREGLEQLPHGPVRLADGHTADRQNHPDRAATVLGAHRATQRLIGAS